MKVTLHKNSWHVNLYRWVTGENPTYNFKSICPYFWTTIAFVLISPLILIFKGLKLIINKLKKSSNLKTEESKKSKIAVWYDKNANRMFKWTLNLYLGICILILLSGFFLYLYKSVKKFGLLMTLFGMFSIIGAFTVMLLIVYLISSFFESDIWSSIKGMIYSQKNKVCPMIEWK